MSIEEQLRSIENEVFITTNQKLDTYSLAVIRANLLANQPLVKTNIDLSNKIKDSIKTRTNNFGNLPTIIFMPSWGWGLLVLFYIIVGMVFYSVVFSNTREYKKITAIIKYDTLTKQYFINNTNYRVSTYQKQKGVYLKFDEE